LNAEIHASGAQGDSLPLSDVIVAVLDTGIDPMHGALVSHLIPGATFVSGTTSTLDDHGHGTEVATVLETTAENDSELVRPRGRVRIMPVKVADARGHTNDREVAQGIRWAVDQGARIINISLGTEDIPEMREAIAYAAGKALVVAAAGFGGPAYPADDPQVLAATGSAAQVRVRARRIHLYNLVLAPSTGVTVRGRDGNLYDVAGFTSIAAARVSGLAALLLSVRPDLTVEQLRKAIQHGADPASGGPRRRVDRARGPVNRDRSLQIVMAMPDEHTVFPSPEIGK